MAYVTFEAPALVKALNLVKRVVLTRTPVAQLKAVKIERDALGQVCVSATDCDMILSIPVESARMDCDAFTIELADLLKLAASADKGALVTITPESVAPGADQLTRAQAVDADGLSATITGFDLEHYPAPVAFERAPESVIMPERDLHAALTACAASMSSEETRYYLQGVYMAATDQTRGALAFTATDGHRLSHVMTTHTLADEFGVIVPNNAINALLPCLNPKSAAPVVIQWNRVNKAGRAEFIGAGFHLITKTIDGTFPDYTRVIPALDKSESVVKIDWQIFDKQFTRALKLYNKSKISFELSDARAVVTCTESEKEIAFAHNWNTRGNSELEITFNSKYVKELTEAFRVFGDSHDISLIKDAPARFDFYPAKEFATIAKAIGIIMPMRR